MTSSETGFIDRVVEVLADAGATASPRWVRGSGLLVGGRRVLTSAHVLGGAHNVYVRGVRAGRKEVWQASVVDPGDPQDADIALLEVSDAIEELPALPFARVDRRAQVPEVVPSCHAVGFPQFMEYVPPDGTPIREAAHVIGEVPTLDRLVSELLTLRVKSSPQPLPPRTRPIHQSPWSGMSGAVVVAGDVVIGVVTEHFPRAGDAQLTVTPITHIDRLPPARQQVWRQALGIDPANLPAYRARVEPLPVLIKPGRVSAVAAGLSAVLAGFIAGVLTSRWGWGLSVAAMTSTAVLSGSAAVKLLRIGSMLDRTEPAPTGPAGTQPTQHHLDITANQIDVKHSVIAAGDVNQYRQTNIRLGGFAAIGVTVVLALIGSFGTVVMTNPAGTPPEQQAFVEPPPVSLDDNPTSDSRPGQWACPAENPLNGEHVALLSAETTFAELVSALRGMVAFGGQVGATATTLATAVERLSPPPTTSLEALGRLRFAGTDLDAALTDLNTAVQSACGSPQFGDGVLAYVKDTLRPQPVSGGVLAGDAYGRCGAGEIGWIAPFSQVLDCKDGTVALIDMTTGAVGRVTGLPTDDGTRLILAGDKLVWATVATTPAQGLSQERWKATLHIRDLGKGDETTVAADEGTGTAPEPSNVVLGGWQNRILLSSGQKYRMVDAAGKTLWTAVDNAGHGFVRPTSSTLWADPTLIDANTGKILRDYGPADLNYYFESNGCGNSAVLNVPEGIWLTESADGRRTVRNLAFEQNVNIVTATTPTLVNMDSSSGLHGVTVKGAVTWDIPAEITKSSEIVGRWIVVTNPSDNKVLVDAATGRDATSAQPTVADLLFRAGGKLTLAYGDPTTDAALVRGDAGGGTVLRASWTAVCT